MKFTTLTHVDMCFVTCLYLQKYTMEILIQTVRVFYALQSQEFRNASRLSPDCRGYFGKECGAVAVAGGQISETEIQNPNGWEYL